MKKLCCFVLALVCVLALIGCGGKDTEDILCMGLNAEITKIDPVNHILYVADPSDEGIFGEKSAIACQKLIDGQNIIYVDYNTHEVTNILFSDLAVGDHIIVNAYQSRLNAADAPLEVEQIQLGTQKFN